jgi:hypothetical protein
MDNSTILHSHASKEMVMAGCIQICKRADPLIILTAVGSTQTVTQHMSLQRRPSLMSQDGSTILDRLTNRGEEVDMVSGGMTMEMSILVDMRRATKHKVRSMSCRKMAHTRCMNVRMTSWGKN